MFQTNDPNQKERRKNLRNNMTPAEKELWKYLREKQLEGIKFRRQFGVGPYILDFYYCEKRLCIEVDGDTHGTEPARTYDKERTYFLEGKGITVLRYRNIDIYENIRGVLENIWTSINTPPKNPNNTPPNLP